eukprot:5796400-Prymnesium_polylepis.2
MSAGAAHMVMRTPATHAPQHGLECSAHTTRSCFLSAPGSPNVQQGGFFQPTPTFTRLARGCAPDTDTARRTCAIADESVSQIGARTVACGAHVTATLEVQFSSTLLRTDLLALSCPSRVPRC